MNSINKKWSLPSIDRKTFWRPKCVQNPCPYSFNGPTIDISHFQGCPYYSLCTFKCIFKSQNVIEKNGLHMGCLAIFEGGWWLGSNVVVFDLIQMQVFWFSRIQPGGNPVTACTVHTYSSKHCYNKQYITYWTRMVVLISGI